MPVATPSQCLRVVGQEFEKNKVSDFEVVFEPDGCRVRGAVPPKPVELPPQSSRTSFLKGLFKPASPNANPATSETAPQSETWERRYTWSDLDHLDEEQRTKRRGVGGVPDDYSTSQMLRVVGVYAERRRWALAGVARTRHIIEIRHRQADGRIEAVSQKFAELYDFSVRLSQSRRTDAAEAR